MVGNLRQPNVCEILFMLLFFEGAATTADLIGTVESLKLKR